jgi:hypothetical protein
MAKRKAANDFTFEGAPDAPIQPKRGAVIPLAEVPMANVHDFAALAAFADALKTVTALTYAKLEIAATNMLIAAGCESKAVPPNFIGVEDEHSATCMLIRRAAGKALNEVEVKALKEKDIPISPETTTAETYVFNAELVPDQELMKRIETAIQGVPDLPKNIILHVKPQTHHFVTDETLKTLFTLPPEDVMKLLGIVMSFGMRSKYNVIDGNVLPMIQRVSKLMGLPELHTVVLESVVPPPKKKKEKKGKKDDKDKEAEAE